MAKGTILVATRELRGGKPKGEIETIAAHEELTSERLKALGLDKEGIKALVASGAVIEVPAHVASSNDDSAEVKAAEKRADEAEKKAGELETQVATLTAEKKDLETKLEAAQTAAAKAQGN